MRIIDCAVCVLAFCSFACSAGVSDNGQGGEAESVGSAASESEALRFPRLCDGPLNLTCQKGQYCSSAIPGRCPSKAAFGVCGSEPQLCSDLYAPVCGCDGETYANNCFAAAAGAALEHQGKCAPKGRFCGGIAGIRCPGFGKCVDDPTDNCDPKQGGADCGGLCACIQNVLCVTTSHFDSDPNVCACVPNADPCATVRCSSGTHCVPQGTAASCQAD